MLERTNKALKGISKLVGSLIALAGAGVILLGVCWICKVVWVSMINL